MLQVVLSEAKMTMRRSRFSSRLLLILLVVIYLEWVQRLRSLHNQLQLSHLLHLVSMIYSVAPQCLLKPLKHSQWLL